MTEELYDIKGSDHLVHTHGERFRGWYLTKTYLRTETLPLEYKDFDLSYRFKVFDYNFKFFIPSKLEFVGGIISYSDAERQLRMFRYPQDEEGGFTSPLTAAQIKEQLINLSEDDLRELLRKRKVLTFEAFRIPQFGFEYFGLSGDDESDITKITDKSFFDDLKKHSDAIVFEKIREVKGRISSGPDYLLILQNILDRQWKNIEEACQATNKIIWI